MCNKIKAVFHKLNLRIAITKKNLSFPLEFNFIIKIDFKRNPGVHGDFER